MFIVAIVTGIFTMFDGTGLAGFLETFFQGPGFTVGMLGTLLIGYLGERRFLNIEANSTLTTIVAILSAALPILFSEVDWNPLLILLGDFTGAGSMTWGALIGVIVNYFGDIRIGRPVEPSGQLIGDGSYKMRDLPKIVFTGRR